MRSTFPVNRIWNLCQPGHEHDAGVDLDEDRDVDLLIRRQGLEVVVEVLDAADFAMLVALAEGGDFASAYERALETDRTFDPAAFLHKHLTSGVLIDFTLPAEALAP